jgi:hypothetical protein
MARKRHQGLQGWEMKAEEYRTLADTCRHPLSRQTFLHLAEYYEGRIAKARCEPGIAQDGARGAHGVAQADR